MNSSGPFSGLSTRARNVLDRLGVRSVAELRRLTDYELLKARSCGLGTLREIRAWLDKQSPDAGFTPDGKSSIGDSAVEELRRKIVVAIGDSAPLVRAAEIDTLIAEFADGLIDRERGIWQKELVEARAAGDTPPRNGPGELHVGANDKGEVVINLPCDMTGHIVFSPSQARHLAVVLIRQAAAAANEPLPGGFGS